MIRQWTDALETLRRDGLLLAYARADGPADGSDLPARGRLAALLDEVYQLVPGPELIPHLTAKRGGRKPPPR